MHQSIRINHQRSRYRRGARRYLAHLESEERRFREQLLATGVRLSGSMPRQAN